MDFTAKFTEKNEEIFSLKEQIEKLQTTAKVNQKTFAEVVSSNNASKKVLTDTIKVLRAPDRRLIKATKSNWPSLLKRIERRSRDRS